MKPIKEESTSKNVRHYLGESVLRNTIVFVCRESRFDDGRRPHIDSSVDVICVRIPHRRRKCLRPTGDRNYPRSHSRPTPEPVDPYEQRKRKEHKQWRSCWSGHINRKRQCRLWRPMECDSPRSDSLTTNIRKIVLDMLLSRPSERGMSSKLRWWWIHVDKF
ncbi:hypothetical protein BKA93DRAFT_573797 [Sparassis latifolia]